MKIICQCDYCGLRDTQDKIEIHESTCVWNKAFRNCYTCNNKKGLCLTKFECQKDVQIPEGQYMSHCPQWEEGPGQGSFTDIFGSLFNGPFGG